MSRLRSNQITNENANGAHNFPHGITVTGIVTATTTSQTLPQIIVGSAVTANSQGIDVTGIVTATSFKGDGSSLTGIDATQIATGNTKVQTVASRIDNKIDNVGVLTVTSAGANVSGILTTSYHKVNSVDYDHYLNLGKFVDLFKIVKQAIYVSQKSYSIKDIEKYYDFKREGEILKGDVSEEFYPLQHLVMLLLIFQ